MDKNGKKWTTNQTDCQAGTTWRCDLDGKNLELLAHNFRNEYEPCVDSFGTVFVSDNDDDGNQQTRICYVMPGGNYGYWPRGPGQSHWHEEQPGVVPKVLRTFFGSPTGICFYEGTLLPEKYRGHLLHCDAGPRHVRRNSKPPPAQTLDFGKYRRNPILLPLHYHDLGASPGQTSGNAAADSSPRPGDDCHSIGERCGKRTRFGSFSRHVAFSTPKTVASPATLLAGERSQPAGSLAIRG